jgi:hypothetical protein
LPESVQANKDKKHKTYPETFSVEFEFDVFDDGGDGSAVAAVAGGGAAASGVMGGGGASTSYPAIEAVSGVGCCTLCFDFVVVVFVVVVVVFCVYFCVVDLLCLLW